MAKPKVTLFVDIVSPFAYLGFYALQVGRQSFLTDQHDSFAAIVTYVLHAPRLVFNAFWWLMRTVDIIFLATVAINRPGSLAHATHCLPPISIRVSCSKLDVLMHSKTLHSTTEKSGSFTLKICRISLSLNNAR